MSDGTTRAPALDPEALSLLAGGLAHELKNPLSTLRLHLQLLREQWQDEELPKARRTVRTLVTLDQEVRRLNDILEDFLRFARTDQIDLKLGPLNPLIEEVVQFVRPEALAEGVAIETFLDANLPLLMLDQARLKQAVLNLVVNARQALADSEGEGRRITVITRPAAADHRHVLIEVVDDGPGMNAKLLERCFETYYSTKGAGSGLGLATVRRIVEAHGGKVELQSSPGHGTRALVLLPVPAGLQ